MNCSYFKFGLQYFDGIRKGLNQCFVFHFILKQ